MKKTLILASLFFSCAALVSCGPKDPDESPRGGKGLKTVEVKRADVVDSIKLRGTIVSSKSISIYAESGGQIVKLHVDQGATVRQGDVLFEIDQEKLTNEVERQKMMMEKTEITYQNLKEDYGRKEALFKEQLISESQFKEAQKSLKLAELDRQMAIKDLELLNVQLGKVSMTSPIDGVVTEKNVKEGEIISKATDGTTKPLLTITDTSTKDIEVFVNEVERGYLETEKPVVFWLDTNPSFRYSGKILQVDAAATRPDKPNQFRSQISILDSNEEFRLGTTANVEVIGKVAKAVLSVPVEAVFKDGAVTYVYVKKAGGHEKRTVQTGVAGIDRVEVLNGLKEGEKIFLEEPV